MAAVEVRYRAKATSSWLSNAVVSTVALLAARGRGDIRSGSIRTLLTSPTQRGRRGKCSIRSSFAFVTIHTSNQAMTPPTLRSQSPCLVNTCPHSGRTNPAFRDNLDFAATTPGEQMDQCLALLEKNRVNRRARPPWTCRVETATSLHSFYNSPHERRCGAPPRIPGC
ncbi:hypothetical protein BAUCODRAFT_333048 [Baudoinia panamericana UAMH 10762]|uniref:Uncharacterized protein n=1 Tax=Baudoinia panamericana (strain UAMH 10762) TaxID=717646 RepID=M2MIC1_BAUPA|nr:uncharacterized protein BAUCODRAFT_333048 [Baudoinia panamericana UAMH 10762]EMC91003.1 hypothetical protein BAUCODRAFT_333048 [Baudoinia panamericana UAMH 10762]